MKEILLQKMRLSSEHCHDCGNKVGGYHDYGCDCERCPEMWYALISCDCNDKYNIEPLNKTVRLFSRSNCM